jgi:hypothetical protein
MVWWGFARVKDERKGVLIAERLQRRRLDKSCAFARQTLDIYWTRLVKIDRVRSAFLQLRRARTAAVGSRLGDPSTRTSGW